MNDNLKYVVAADYFTIDVPSAVEAVEFKRQEFIQMLDDRYAIGFISVATIDFQVCSRGTKVYTHVYLHISITGVSFKLKVVLLNANQTLNAMLRYSTSSVAKQEVNRCIRQLIDSTKELNSEK